MAASPRARGPVRSAAWLVGALAAFAGGLAATLLACIDFDGLDGTEPEGGSSALGDGTGGGDASTASCDAAVASDPYNCGACGHLCPLRLNSIPSCTLGACGLTCNGNFGNCDGKDENGCETQLIADPKNCGACARDCGGGACAGGLCQPITLATNQSNPQALAVDHSTVYWGALYNYTVDKAPKDGGTSTILSSNEVYPSGIALDATHLYWVDRGNGLSDGLVRRIALDGGAPSSLIDGLSSRPTALTVVGTDVYYATLGALGPTQGTIARVPATNVPEAGAGVVVAAAQNNPTFVVADGTNLYWTNYGSAVTADAGAQNGAIMTCALPACAGGPRALAAAQNHPRGITADADYVYWTNFGTGQSDGSIARTPKTATAASPPTILATSLLYPDAVAVDAAYAYFTTRSGTISRVRLAGGAPPETIATLLQSYAVALAVDDAFLYFATPTGPAGGTIQKLLK